MIIKEIISKTASKGPFTFSKAGDVILPASGETPEEIATARCVLEEGVAYGGDINVLRPFAAIDGRFLSYQLNGKRRIEIARLAVGKSVVHLHNDQLAGLTVVYPSRGEQEKIHSFMSLIDARISCQNKIIEGLKCFRDLTYEKLITVYKTEKMSLKELLKRKYIRMIKPSELTPFIGERKYLSTASIDDEGIQSVESIITYRERPSRASMYPIRHSVWFAKMKNSKKVLKSDDQIQKDYILSTGFYGVLCDEQKIKSDWLLETFRSNVFNAQKDRFSEGSSMSGIKDNQLEDILIDVIIDKRDEEVATKLLLSLTSSIKLNSELLKKFKDQKEFLLRNMFI